VRRLPLLRAPWSEAAPVRPSRAATKAPAACSVESDLELDERAEEGGRLITRPKVHSRRRPHRVPNSTLQGGAAPLVVAVCAVGDHAVGTLPRSSAQNDITQLIPVGVPKLASCLEISDFLGRAPNFGTPQDLDEHSEPIATSHGTLSLVRELTHA
jgi:hypothetical protein